MANWIQRSEKNGPLYQDWLFAIQDVFTKNTLAYDTRFVTDEDLTPDQLEPLEKEKDSRLDQLKDVRQSEDIRRALDILENVDRLNQLYGSGHSFTNCSYTKSDQEILRAGHGCQWRPDHGCEDYDA